MSTLICIGTAALWMRSLTVADEAGYVVVGDYWDKTYSLTSLDGALWCGRVITRRSADGEPPAGWFRESAPVVATEAGWKHFEWLHEGEETNARRMGVIVPHWAVVLAALAPPAAWVRSNCRARRRQRERRCRACGYDLRATPDCSPECGRASE